MFKRSKRLHRNIVASSLVVQRCNIIPQFLFFIVVGRQPVSLPRELLLIRDSVAPDVIGRDIVFWHEKPLAVNVVLRARSRRSDDAREPRSFCAARACNRPACKKCACPSTKGKNSFSSSSSLGSDRRELAVIGT